MDQDKYDLVGYGLNCCGSVNDEIGKEVKFYLKHYTNQNGSGFELDNIGTLLKTPRIYQRGRGIGGIFSTIFRYIKPLLKSGLSFIKDEALQTGADVLRGISDQKPLKDVLKNRGTEIVNKLRDKAVEKISKMGGSGRKRKRNISKVIKGSLKKRKTHSNISRVRKKTKPRKKKSAKKQKRGRILDIFS
jgi:hypothetical protein